MIKRIKVGLGSCGIASGAEEVFAFLKEKLADTEITAVGCIGHCYAEPLVEVETDTGSIIYEKVKPDESFIDKLRTLSPEKQLAVRRERSSREMILVTKLAGKIDPVNIDEYIKEGGYSALKKVLALDPKDTIADIKKSGLRGRGGAGFPTGSKWEFLAAKQGSKILICNGDEGDPGAFMDRSMMESVPHQMLEGMFIGAWATGAEKMFIYVRAEYPLAIKNLAIALKQINERGLNVLNGRTVECIIKEGAGAFVCGEETAMINSLEGRRGTPRFRPPFPTDSGFKGMPTAINNVETFCNIPVIINMGGENFAKIGTEKSKGTKLFALAGDLKYAGLIEVPMGITIGEIVYDIGGAERGSVKAVQTGGPSGGCIPVEHFDAPVDYDSLKTLGAIMGSGGLIVIGKDRCMVDTARYFLDFTTRESCGKCTFCRIGTKRMLEKLEKITAGKGEAADLDFLKDLAPKIIKGSLCALGQTAPNPVLTSLRYFMKEYEEHVHDKSCTALKCNALVNIFLDTDKCTKCKLCIKTCPVTAISASFEVNQDLCTRCNSCIEVCPVKAISRTARGGRN